MYTIERGRLAYNTRLSVVERRKWMIRGQGDYEDRLVKYSARGFSIYTIQMRMPALPRQRRGCCRKRVEAGGEW